MKVYVPLRLVLWCALLALSSVFAQVPSAGSIQQNIENAAHQPSLQIQPGPQLLMPKDTSQGGGITFILKRIDYSGNTLLSNARINEVVQPFVNREINFGHLQSLANALETEYRKLGSLARVVIPEQKIIQGILTLQIEESKWGVAIVQGSSKRLAPDRVSKTIKTTQSEGQLLNLNTLERGVLLINDLPGVKVDAILSQSPTPLTTDLIINVVDKAAYAASLQVDNAGPVSVGANRLTGSLGINSPMGIGDMVSGAFLSSEGSTYAYLSYSLPLGYDGLLVAVNGSLMSYRVVTAQFAALGAAGSSSAQGLQATYPFIRSKLLNIYTAVNADYRVFHNRNDPEGLLSQYTVTDYSASIFMNSFDKLAGAGSSSASLVLTSGDTNLTDSPNQASVARTTNAQGSFTKSRYAANRTQFISRGLSVYASLSGQATGANLDSSEMFYLGGINGVRAYPSNEGAGSQGQLITLELRGDYLDTLKTSLFYDYGHVRVNPNDSTIGIAEINSYDQKGAGISISLRPLPGVDLKAIWAKRLGSDSNLTSSGTYQNGSTSSTQLWLTANIGY